MGFIICEKSAAIPIKVFEVTDYIDIFTCEEDVSIEHIVSEIEKILNKINSITIGPGLSKDEKMLKIAETVIKKAIDKQLPIILDADGLYIIQKETHIIEGYKKAILTPNKREFERLCQIKNIYSHLKNNDDTNHTNDLDKYEYKAALELSKRLGNVTIIQKGDKDIITNGDKEEGGLKRCGGQGDILSGIVSAFSAFGVQYMNEVWEHKQELNWNDIPMLAGYAGCCITRKSTKKAFKNHKRAMQTQMILEWIGESFDEFTNENQGKL